MNKAMRTLIGSSTMFRYWDNEKEESWLAIYNQGITRFIITRGILVFGMIVFLPLCYLTVTMSNAGSLLVPLNIAVLTTALCAAIGGILFGIAAWYGTIFSYQQYQREKS